jgi:hypothetical protein
MSTNGEWRWVEQFGLLKDTGSADTAGDGGIASGGNLGGTEQVAPR